LAIAARLQPSSISAAICSRRGDEPVWARASSSLARVEDAHELVSLQKRLAS
jgi:hypothetical protein